jgi:hypothetical protein
MGLQMEPALRRPVRRLNTLDLSRWSTSREVIK